MTIVTIDGYDIHFARRGASATDIAVAQHRSWVDSVDAFCTAFKRPAVFVPDFLHYAPSSPWVGEGLQIGEST